MIGGGCFEGVLARLSRCFVSEFFYHDFGPLLIYLQ